MKKCSKCGVVKDYSEFSKNKSKKDGLQPHCKPCSAVSNKEYHSNNKDKIAVRRKKYIENNRAKLSAYQKNYYVSNKDRLIAHQAEYQRNNKEKRAALANKYTDSLTNWYVVARLRRSNRNIKREDIPPELIEAKRVQIMINRKIKELSK